MQHRLRITARCARRMVWWNGLTFGHGMDAIDIKMFLARLFFNCGGSWKTCRCRSQVTITFIAHSTNPLKSKSKRSFKVQGDPTSFRYEAFSENIKTAGKKNFEFFAKKFVKLQGDLLSQNVNTLSRFFHFL